MNYLHAYTEKAERETMYTSMIVSAVTALFLFFFLRPRQGEAFDTACLRLGGKVTANCYTQIAELIDAYRLSTDRQTWSKLHGVKGLLEALTQSWHLLRIVQVHHYYGKIGNREAWELWCQGFLQAFYTAFALPGAVACLIWAMYPHTAGIMAFSFHREIALRILSLAEQEGAPFAMTELAEIL